MLQVTMAISCNAGSFACTIVFRLHAHWQYILLAVKVMKFYAFKAGPVRNGWLLRKFVFGVVS
jgi:hypothetical protein